MDQNQIENYLLAQAEATRAVIRTRRILAESRAQIPINRPDPAWDEEQFQRMIAIRPRPEQEVKTVNTYERPKFPVRAFLGALAILALIVIAPFAAPQRSEAATAPCTGDGMSTSCSTCIMTAATSEPCGPARVAVAREAAMNAYMYSAGGHVTHAGVRWPVTQDEMYIRKQEVKQQAAEAAAKAIAPPEPSATDYATVDNGDGTVTHVQRAASTTGPVLLESGDDFPLTGGQIVFLAVLCLGGVVLATKHFSPSLYTAGVGRVHHLNSTVAPHAKDARRGLRKFLPGLYWMGSFTTLGGFVCKVVLPLAAVWYVWSALGNLVGFWLRIVAVIAFLVALGRIDGAKAAQAAVDIGRWWEPKQFTNALLAAGIVAAPKKDAPEPVSIAVGRPRMDDFGTEAKFDLPGALTVLDVNRKIGPLAKALKVPASRLLADQGATDPEGVVTVWIGTGKGEQVQIASIPVPNRHDATQPFDVGRTVKGEPISITTRNRQTLLAGRPGMGKTFLARRMVLHWLADPKGRVLLVDAKGDNDYAEGKEQFTAYVTAAEEDRLMISNVEKVLTHVYEVVLDHNSRRRLNQNPTLLVLEEWWSVLAVASEISRPVRNRIDFLMAEISKKGRAANVHVLLISQEVRAESITAKIRSMFQQQMAFSLANDSEQRMVFGSNLTVRPAVSEGEVNVQVNGVQSWVKGDLLDDQTWVTAVQSMTPRESLTLTEVKAIDPLTLAVLEALEAEGDLEPKVLFDLLPEEVRTNTPATLGKALGALGIRSEKVAGRNVYRLAAVQNAVQGR